MAPKNDCNVFRYITPPRSRLVGAAAPYLQSVSIDLNLRHVPTRYSSR